MTNGDKKKKSDEWDSREREWTREMRKTMSGARFELEHGVKKFDPRKRFRLILVCFGIFLISIFALLLTSFIIQATFQAIISMFGSIISGMIFVANYGKDIVVSVLNFLSKYSSR